MGRQVDCSRCGNTAEGLERPPMQGDLGRRVHEGTCAGCWQEWLQAQVILINEQRLSGTDAGHVERMMASMRAFLNLRDE